MAVTGTASLTIAEMREFAGLTAAEQRYIRRSLDIGLGRCDAFRTWGRSSAENAAIRSRCASGGVCPFGGGVPPVSVANFVRHHVARNPLRATHTFWAVRLTS